jgi:hypothetical protein
MLINPVVAFQETSTSESDEALESVAISEPRFTPTTEPVVVATATSAPTFTPIPEPTFIPTFEPSPTAMTEPTLDAPLVYLAPSWPSMLLSSALFVPAALAMSGSFSANFPLLSTTWATPSYCVLFDLG